MNEPIHATTHMNQQGTFEVKPEMDITIFYKTISAKGKEVMNEKRAQGEAMHLAPLGYKTLGTN